jgi:hypothetical protein
MMAMTTNSSIRVKPPARRNGDGEQRSVMDRTFSGTGW